MTAIVSPLVVPGISMEIMNASVHMSATCSLRGCWCYGGPIPDGEAVSTSCSECAGRGHCKIHGDGCHVGCIG